MKKYFAAFLLIFAAFSELNAQNYQEFEFKTGDLLFQVGKENDFEKAIVTSTSNQKNLNFSHIGVAYFENDSLFVLEATPKFGVCKTYFTDFLKESSQIVVGRLKSQYQYCIPNAISTIKSLIGKSYDFIFCDENAYYCSELVQTSFKDKSEKHIFETIPMSFKDENTDEILPYWIEYYKKYDKPIPEGHLGSNPNQLFKSEKIDDIYEIEK
jgi:hypothetical protein